MCAEANVRIFFACVHKPNQRVRGTSTLRHGRLILPLPISEAAWVEAAKTTTASNNDVAFGIIFFGLLKPESKTKKRGFSIRWASSHALKKWYTSTRIWRARLQLSSRGSLGFVNQAPTEDEVEAETPTSTTSVEGASRERIFPTDEKAPPRKEFSRQRAKCCYERHRRKFLVSIFKKERFVSQL